MTPLDLDQLERLHAAATPGPWHRIVTEVYRDRGLAGNSIIADCSLSAHFDTKEKEANAALVAAMHTALPALVRELRARRRQVERLTAAHRDICQGFLGPERRIAEAALDESNALEPAAPAKGGEGEK